MSQLSESDAEMPSPAPERLAIAGSGTIACGLASCALARGFEVTILARSDESAGRATAALEMDAEKRDERGALERLCVTTALQELRRSTVVVEAVTEDEYVKRQVFEDVAPLLDGETLLATTTSSLSVAELSRAARRPACFFGLHVFNPVDRMALVELCFPAGVASETRARAAALCAALGKTAVEVPDEPGFVVNRLLFPYLFDAVRLLERTGLEPEEIDDCMKLGASYPMGPLELLDFVGLDVADAIGEAIHADTGDPAHRPPGRIKQMVGERRLGRKTGAGFYRYD